MSDTKPIVKEEVVEAAPDAVTSTETITKVEPDAAVSAVKAEPSITPASALADLSPADAEKEAFRQIEFYFSDTNFPFDKFLWTLSRKDDGWVPISTLASFKRMRAIRDILGAERILEVLKPSKLLEVDTENQKVKRKKELVPQKDAYERSIYAKGFPAETETLQQEMEKFFGQFGRINAVRMRREDKKPPKAFKGSVFVEFALLDEMNAFLEKAKAEEGAVKFGDHPLLVMSKDEYCQMKMKEKGIDPSSARRGPPAGKSSGAKSAPMSRPGKFNAFVEMEREAKGLPSSEEARAQQIGGYSGKRDPKPKAQRSDPLEFTFQDKQLTTRPDETVDPDEVAFPAQSVIAFEGAGDNGHWKELKEQLLLVAPTSFVEFGQGATAGAAGFKETLTDDQYNEIVGKAIQVGGKPITWSRVDEERAKQFYVDRANFRAKYLIDQREQGGNGPSRGGFGGRGGRGGRGGGRGGRGGRGGGRDHGARGGEKRKRNADEDVAGTKAGGSAPTLSSKKVKEE